LLIPSFRCRHCQPSPRPLTPRGGPARSCAGMRSCGVESLQPQPQPSRGSGVLGRVPLSTAPRLTWIVELLLCAKDSPAVVVAALVHAEIATVW